MPADPIDIADLLAAAHITATDFEPIPSSQGHIIYLASGPDGDFIIRVASDDVHLGDLRREVRLLAGLRDWVTLRIPDTRIVEAQTPFAIHCQIPGDPLAIEHYEESSPSLRERLAVDLATFFREAHAVPLELACAWLGEVYEGWDAAAVAHGKPGWFGPDDVAALRQTLRPNLTDLEHAIFERTVTEFEALAICPEYMVFGHGDMHGYNVAVGEDALGP
ncbi:MAG: aminoglycoside phosphotransferase family protein, partial [Anaerolineae bacterium]|nr:aminoglycoside phosphotransferase family protein [Anaerolineae bacterium]